MSDAIVLENVSKTYAMGDVAVHALRAITLRIARGEYVAIMGPSGSGKSTLMNLIGCLDRPSSGRYVLDGEDVARLDDEQLAKIRLQKLGFIFQAFNLLPRATALRNVSLPLFYAGVPTKERELRAADLLRELGLEGRALHRPAQLSGGEQQRVAIARALANDPAVLLADEPTGNLDSRTSDEILAIFDRLNEAGRTIVLVTHDETIAGRARRTVRLLDGTLQSDTALNPPGEPSARI